MQFIPKNVRKFQQGGSMLVEEPVIPETAPTEEVPADGEGLDPMMMLAEAAAQALQAQDCQIAMQVCLGLIALVQQMGGGAPQEPQGEPVFAKNGAKLVRRIPRNR